MAKKHLTPALLSSAVAAGLMATAMPANAVKFSASGQINKVIGDIDDGVNSGLGFFDNINSGTRIRFRGSEELDNGITIGGYQEWQMSNNASSSSGFQTNGEFGEGAAATLGARHFDIYASGSWGKVSLGQGNGAANGTSEVDLSGTWHTDYVGGNQCLLGGITFGNTSIGPGTTNPTLDGETRNQRIRYDSPTLGDVVSLAASLGNGGLTEVAGWLNVTFGSTQLSAAIGITDNDDRDRATVEGIEDDGAGTVVATNTGIQGEGRERTMISGSLLLGNGLNFTLSTMEQEDSGDIDDNEIDYFKVGYKSGKHAISVSFTDGGGGTQAIGSGLSNIEGEGQAIGYSYSAADSLTLYASWRTLEVDSGPGVPTNADDIDALHAGALLSWSSN